MALVFEAITRGEEAVGHRFHGGGEVTLRFDSIWEWEGDAQRRVA
jgi:hypothetical protein